MSPFLHRSEPFICSGIFFGLSSSSPSSFLSGIWIARRSGQAPRELPELQASEAGFSLSLRPEPHCAVCIECGIAHSFPCASDTLAIRGPSSHPNFRTACFAPAISNLPAGLMGCRFKHAIRLVCTNHRQRTARRRLRSPIPMNDLLFPARAICRRRLKSNVAYSLLRPVNVFTRGRRRVPYLDLIISARKLQLLSG